MWASKLHWRSPKKFQKSCRLKHKQSDEEWVKFIPGNAAISAHAETHGIKWSCPGPLELFVRAGVVSMRDACVRS